MSDTRTPEEQAAERYVISHLDNTHISVNMIAREGYTACLKERALPAEQRVAELEEEVEALKQDRLTPQVFTRLAEWLKDPKHRPATDAFTHGMERQIAYALELDVIPYVKRLEKEVERLRDAAQVSADALDVTSRSLDTYGRHPIIEKRRDIALTKLSELGIKPTDR